VRGLWAGRPRNRGSIAEREKRGFASPHHSDQFWGPHSLLYNVYREIFPGDQATKRKAEYSICLQLVPRFEDAWSYTSISLYVFVVCLITHKDSFTFFFFFSTFERPDFNTLILETTDIETKQREPFRLRGASKLGPVRRY
jgi:hypothetical protein